MCNFLIINFTKIQCLVLDPTTGSKPLQNAGSFQIIRRREVTPLLNPREVKDQEKKKYLSSDFIYSQVTVFLVEKKTSILLIVEDDPKTFNKSMLSKGASFWREVVNDEMGI